MNLLSTDRCLRHIFLKSIVIEQVKSSDTESLCSGWSCQKALAEGVGSWLSCCQPLFAGGEWLTDGTQPRVLQRWQKGELQLLTYVHTQVLHQGSPTWLPQL